MKDKASPPLLSKLEKLGVEDAAAHRDLRSSFFEESPWRPDETPQPRRRVPDENPQPFAGFGSFRQRHGDVSGDRGGRPSRLAGFSIEAPAKLESGQVGQLPIPLLASDDSDKHTQLESAAFDDIETNNQLGPLDASRSALPVDIIPHRPDWYGQMQPRLKLQHKGRSFSTDLDREEAWERKKELYLADGDDDDDGDGEDVEDIFGVDSEEEDDYGAVPQVYDGDDDNYHDCEDADDDTDVDDGEAGNPQYTYKHVTGHSKKPGCPSPVKPLQRTRTRSLTDEDLEELKGSIDLGFGFSRDESCNLKSTLPALELYYAINRQYADAKGRGSPVSPLDGNSLARTSSAGSNSSPSNETWRISSPGDHPSQVKTRLRHWAQAVACSIKQGF